jgi:molybdate transport system regulatory protein
MTTDSLQSAALPSAGFSEALGHAPADKRLEVLRRVGETGSISQAARDAGISYKAAWQAIDTLTSLSGVALVERTVGGSGGGGARITPAGQALLALAQQLAQARERVLSGFAGGAQLAGGLGLRTSMRNQLLCAVVACEPLGPDDPLVLIRLRTAGGAALAASVTRESADLLALQPGERALVLCKATAVSVLPGDPPDDPPQGGAALNRLAGRIDRIARGQGRDEVVLTLDGGGQWVGFAEHPLMAEQGARAWAGMSASALVVGLAG